MAPRILYHEPDELIQGDTWQWIIRSDRYPASDGWTLTYDLAGASQMSFAATTDPDSTSYDILVAQATTQLILPGLYTWNASVRATAGTYAGQKFTVERGTFRIVSNYATAGPGTKQAFAEQMLWRVEAEMLARMPGTGAGHVSYSLEGRAISKYSLQELRVERAKWKSEVEMLSRGGRLPPVAIVFGRRPAGVANNRWRD